MGSDRARRTFDPGRKYRRVVAQQGRAIVEADLNEAQEIITEEIRHEALDIVGPAGTPDNGYMVMVPAPPPGPISITAVDLSTNTLTAPAHGLYQRAAVTFAADASHGGVLPSGLVAGTTYYVIYVDGNNFQVTATWPSGGLGSPVAGSLVDAGHLPFSVTMSPLQGDIQIGAGTMYVGGMRIEQKKPVLYSNQPDSMGGESNPYKPRIPSTLPQDELVYLQLTETEVSAAEDMPLREVALGGPDTAQRTRLLQQIVRFSLTPGTTDCATADGQLFDWFTPQGLHFDPSDMRLRSTCKLQATFAPPTSSDPCLPAAQTGYLGAQNQLIRVMISQLASFGDGPNPNPLEIVWAYDNASAFYRVTALTNTGTGTLVLTLATPPVDAAHQPRADQFAEFFLPSGWLDAHGNAALQPAGFLIPIDATAYDPNKNTLTLTASFGSTVVTVPGPFFVRIWEAKVALTANTPLAIGSTGLSVTLSTEGSDPFVIGQYWMLALRPNAPTQVFPQRYLDAPQPAEGPRQWICPLGVVHWDTSGSTPVGTVIDDCRQFFGRLTNVSAHPGWLNIIVGPSDIPEGLQGLIDWAMSRWAGQKVIIGLLPGTYTLPQPLVLTARHNGLTLQARRGAVLKAGRSPTVSPSSTSPAPSTLPTTSFLHGLILVQGSTDPTSSTPPPPLDVTLDGLTLQMPCPLYSDLGGSFFGMWTATPPDGTNPYYLANYGSTDARSGPAYLDFHDLYTMVGVRVIGGRSTIVRVKNCVFDYANAPTPDGSLLLFAAGVLATGSIFELDVKDSLFAVPPALTPLNEDVLAFGILHVPTSQILPTAFTAGDTEATRAGELGGTTLPATLVTGQVRGSVFLGLTAAALYDCMPGILAFEDNVVNGCYAGLWTLHTGVTTRNLDSLLTDINSSVGAGGANVDTTASTTSLADNVRRYLYDPLYTTGTAIARAYPLPDETLGLGPATPSSTVIGMPPYTLNDFLSPIEALTIPSFFTALHLNESIVPTSVHVTDNEFGGALANPWLLGAPTTIGIDATVPPPPAGAGTQLLIWDYYTSESSSTGASVPRAGATVTLGNNQIFGTANVAVALTLQARSVAVTGNTIENWTSDTTFSLISLPKVPVSVGYRFSATGNSFTSPSVMPKRPAMTYGGDSLETVPWYFFNYEQSTPA